MITLRSSPHGCEVRLLSALNADPDRQRTGREAVIPLLAWAERISLLAAREKCGKSTLATAGAAAVSSGTDFLGFRVRQRPVLWVTLEEHIDDVTARLNEFGADDEWVFIVDALSDPLNQLEAIVARMGRLDFLPPLVIVDSLAAIASGIVSEGGNAAQWTPLMTRLAALAHVDGAAVLVLHHSRKSDGKYRDSTAIGANVDMILEMSASSENERRLTPNGRWRVEAYTVRLADGGFRLVAGGKPVEEYVVDIVRLNPGCSKNGVRDAVKAAHDEVDAAVARLIDQSRIENRGSEHHFKLYMVQSDA